LYQKKGLSLRKWLKNARARHTAGQKKRFRELDVTKTSKSPLNKRYHQPAIHVLISEFTMGTLDRKTGAA
jgi:hypothetical protein